MNGFMMIDKRWVNSYEISHIQVCHGKAGSEMHMTSGKVLYSDLKPGEVMELVTEAREENEGHD